MARVATIPKDVRTRLNDVNKELKKVKGKIHNAYARLIESKLSIDDCTDPKSPNYIGKRVVTVFDEKWLTEAGGEWDNPATGKKETVRITSLEWFEKMGKATSLISIPRKKVKKYFKEARETLVELAEKKKMVKLVESLGSADPADIDLDTWDTVNSSNSSKYLPFQPGPYTRQMYIYDQWKMLSRAFSLYNYNPLAHAGIEIKSAFTIGTGPRVIIKDNPQAQAVWDAYVEKMNYVSVLRTRDKMLSTNGEFFLELYPGRNGAVGRSIDPGTVYEIITEPRDITQVYGLVLMYATQYQFTGIGAKGEQMPISEFIYETIPPEDIIHIRINVQENEKRGRSDLLAAMNVCTWFMDFLKLKVLQAMAQAAYTWDISVQNAESGDIDEMVTNEHLTAAKPMSTFIHNDKVVRTAVQAQSGQGTGRSTTFEELVTAFCMVTGLSKEYIGVSEGGTRATAITSTEPSVKVFLERRSVWEPVIKREAQYIVGSNGLDIPLSSIEVAWPEIAPENASEKIANIVQGITEKFLSRKRAAMMYAKEMDITSYDYEKELKDITSEVLTDVMSPNYGMPAIDPLAQIPPPANQPVEAPPLVQGDSAYASPNAVTNTEKKAIKKQSQG